jgi:uncharacterized membrane protein
MNRLQGLSGRRWPVLALIASLLLNAFLIGLLATDTFRHKRRGDGPRVVAWELRRLAGRLPPEALDRISADLAPVAEGFDERFRTLRARREAISRLAAEPNPDRQAIDAQLAEVRAEGERLQADVQRATYDALLRLAPEVRARLADPTERR